MIPESSECVFVHSELRCRLNVDHAVPNRREPSEESFELDKCLIRSSADDRDVDSGNLSKELLASLHSSANTCAHE